MLFSLLCLTAEYLKAFLPFSCSVVCDFCKGARAHVNHTHAATVCSCDDIPLFGNAENSGILLVTPSGHDTEGLQYENTGTREQEEVNFAPLASVVVAVVVVAVVVVAVVVAVVVYALSPC